MAIYVESNELGGGIVTEQGVNGSTISFENEPYSHEGITTKGSSCITLNTVLVDTAENITYSPAIKIQSDPATGSIELLTDTNTSINSDRQARISLSTYGSSSTTGSVQNGVTISGWRINLTAASNISVDTRQYKLESVETYTVKSKSILFGLNGYDESGAPETKYYNIEDFALKSDIPAGVDLTNYQGDWKLLKEDQIDGRTYTSTFEQSTITLAGSLPITKLLLTSENSAGRISEQGFINTEGPDGTMLWYSDNITYEQYLAGEGQNKSFKLATTMPSGMAIIDSEQNGLTTTNVITCSKNTNIELSISTSNSHNDICNIILERTGDISFGYTQANEYKSINLSALVDRIAQLESTVAELQSQLDAKANTANPAFTGKVSISNQ